MPQQKITWTPVDDPQAKPVGGKIPQAPPALKPAGVSWTPVDGGPGAAQSPVIDAIRSGMSKVQGGIHSAEPYVSAVPGAGWLIHALEQVANPDNAGTTAGAIAGTLGSLAGPEVAIPAAGIVSTIAANTIGKKPIQQAQLEGIANAGAQGVGEALPFLAPYLKNLGVTTTAKALKPSSDVIDSMYYPGLDTLDKQLLLGKQSLESGIGVPGTRAAKDMANAHMDTLRGAQAAELEGLQGSVDPRVMFSNVRTPLNEAQRQITGRVGDTKALQGVIQENMNNPLLSDPMSRTIPAKIGNVPGIGQSAIDLMNKRGIPVPQVELSPEVIQNWRQLKPEIPLSTASDIVTQEGKNLRGTFDNPDVNKSVVDLGKGMRADLNAAVREQAPGLADINDQLSEFIPLRQAYADAAKLDMTTPNVGAHTRYVLGGLLNPAAPLGAIGHTLYNTGNVFANPTTRLATPNALRLLVQGLFNGGNQ